MRAVTHPSWLKAARPCHSSASGLQLASLSRQRLSLHRRRGAGRQYLRVCNPIETEDRKLGVRGKAQAAPRYGPPSGAHRLEARKRTQGWPGGPALARGSGFSTNGGSCPPLRSSKAAANTVEIGGTWLLRRCAESPDVREQAMDLGAIDRGSRARQPHPLEGLYRISGMVLTE